MRVTPEMTERAYAVLADSTWCPKEEAGWIAHQMLEAALGPETPRERAQARHITQIERARVVEQQMWAERVHKLSTRVRELELALNAFSAVRNLRRFQRVLRSLAQAASACVPGRGRQPDEKI